ncbi:MAG: hypothetical protein WA261_21180, partial [Candidatus Sulfotelmatobacter sp.]
YRTFEVTAPETEGSSIYELGNGQWNVNGLRRVLEDIIEKNAQVKDFEVSHDFPKLGPRTMVLNARRVELQPGHPSILVAIEDVSRRSQRGVA